MELRVKGRVDGETFAKRLRDARESVHYTQKELADYLGVSARTFQYWESGLKLPHPTKRRQVLAWIEFIEGVAA